LPDKQPALALADHDGHDRVDPYRAEDRAGQFHPFRREATRTVAEIRHLGVGVVDADLKRLSVAQANFEAAHATRFVAADRVPWREIVFSAV